MGCMDGRKQRISPERFDTHPLHEVTMRWLDQLVFDMKLQLLGEQPEYPIDMTRLEQWARYRNELERCKERLRVY